MNPIKTGKITDNLYAVQTFTVNFFIYSYANGFICFDSGFIKKLILNQLEWLDIDPVKITHVFLTHSDFDHTLGLPLFKNAKIYLSSDEEQMITQKRARKMGIIYNFKINRPYSLLNDQELVTVGTSKIRAIATPGHTPGSMCYLLNESVLFVGDTFKLQNNQVYPIRRIINMDTEKQKESIRKLAHLENVQLACTAHNGCTTEFNEAIRKWR